MAALLGVLVGARGGDRPEHGRSGPGLSPDPQVITSGFESMDALRTDAIANATGDKYSAWLVESSRFMGVPPAASCQTALAPTLKAKSGSSTCR